MEGHVEQFLRKYPNFDRLKIVSHLDHFSCILHCCIQCVGIAKGLHYLHSVNIVHGDLKMVSSMLLSGPDYRITLTTHPDEWPYW